MIKNNSSSHGNSNKGGVGKGVGGGVSNCSSSSRVNSHQAQLDAAVTAGIAKFAKPLADHRAIKSSYSKLGSLDWTQQEVPKPKLAKNLENATRYHPTLSRLELSVIAKEKDPKKKLELAMIKVIKERERGPGPRYNPSQDELKRKGNHARSSPFAVPRSLSFGVANRFPYLVKPNENLKEDASPFAFRPITPSTNLEGGRELLGSIYYESFMQGGPGPALSLTYESYLNTSTPIPSHGVLLPPNESAPNSRSASPKAGSRAGSRGGSRGSSPVQFSRPNSRPNSRPASAPTNEFLLGDAGSIAE